MVDHGQGLSAWSQTDQRQRPSQKVPRVDYVAARENTMCVPCSCFFQSVHQHLLRVPCQLTSRVRFQPECMVCMSSSCMPLILCSTAWPNLQHRCTSDCERSPCADHHHSSFNNWSLDMLICLVHHLGPVCCGELKIYVAQLHSNVAKHSQRTVQC